MQVAPSAIQLEALASWPPRFGQLLDLWFGDFSPIRYKQLEWSSILFSSNASHWKCREFFRPEKRQFSVCAGSFSASTLLCTFSLKIHVGGEIKKYHWRDHKWVFREIWMNMLRGGRTGFFFRSKNPENVGTWSQIFARFGLCPQFWYRSQKKQFQLFKQDHVTSPNPKSPQKPRHQFHFLVNTSNDTYSRPFTNNRNDRQSFRNCGHGWW